MNDFLKTLKAKEKDLEIELSNDPRFKQLEGIRSTIALFENEASENGNHSEFQGKGIPTEYSANLTWREKVLFALNKLGKTFLKNVVDFLKKQGETETDDWLSKRVGVTLSRLKKVEGIVGVRSVGKKKAYFIK